MPVFETRQPEREQVDALDGPTLIVFGTDWCGYCQAAQPLIDRALARHPRVRALMVEDGSGRVPGRSFRVKLWPTLIFMRDGEERARLVRPGDEASIEEAMRVVQA
ncbi:thioredoxin family protein [Pseudomonas sp. LRF_L74]|uniref:thioredoxin family protein n=1 Tax=Pseudomonas sp. LRF_L74 TaxID=3369422 RepID=UPI003F619F9B